MECCRLQAVKRKAVGSINESGACAIGGRWHCQKEEHAPPVIYGRPNHTRGWVHSRKQRGDGWQFPITHIETRKTLRHHKT